MQKIKLTVPENIQTKIPIRLKNRFFPTVTSKNVFEKFVFGKKVLECQKRSFKLTKHFHAINQMKNISKNRTVPKSFYTEQKKNQKCHLEDSEKNFSYRKPQTTNI